MPTCCLWEWNYLRYHKKKNFLKLAWENDILQKALFFVWNQFPELPRSHFHCLSYPQGGSSILPLTGLTSEPVARAPPPCWSSPIQHQASSVFVSSCSPSVHFRWGLQDLMAMVGTWANARKQNKRVNSFVWGIMCSPNFGRPAMWPCLLQPILDSPGLPPGIFPSHSDALLMCSSPLCWTLPPGICREWAGSPCGV